MHSKAPYAGLGEAALIEAAPGVMMTNEQFAAWYQSGGYDQYMSDLNAAAAKNTETALRGIVDALKQIADVAGIRYQKILGTAQAFSQSPEIVHYFQVGTGQIKALQEIINKTTESVQYGEAQAARAGADLALKALVMLEDTQNRIETASAKLAQAGAVAQIVAPSTVIPTEAPPPPPVDSPPTPAAVPDWQAALNPAALPVEAAPANATGSQSWAKALELPKEIKDTPVDSTTPEPEPAGGLSLVGLALIGILAWYLLKG